MGPIRSEWIRSIGKEDRMLRDSADLKVRRFPFPATQPGQAPFGGSDSSSLMPVKGGLPDLARLSESQFRWPMRSCQVAIGRASAVDSDRAPRGFSAYMMKVYRSAVLSPLNTKLPFVIVIRPFRVVISKPFLSNLDWERKRR